MGYFKYFVSTFCYIMPYLIYIFVILTFLPKSLHKIKIFAKNNYDSNRYHRCYSPDECCHSTKGITKKIKTRKAVTRNEQNYHKNISKFFEKTNVPQPKSMHHVEVTNPIEEFTTKNDGININKKRENVVQKQMYPNSNVDDNIMIDGDENLNKNGVIQSNSDWNMYNEVISQSVFQKPYFNTTTSKASTVAISPKMTASSNSSPFFRNGRLNAQPNLEDIFVTITRNVDKTDHAIINSCNYLTPVNSIDDILSQRRLSRPLSAYSISDLLLNEENSRFVMDDAYIDNFLHALNGS